MLKKIFTSALVSLFMMSSACLADDSNLTSSVDDFTWNYFKTLNKDGNIFYSPYSLSTALSVVANGSEGQTQAELLQALSTNSLNDLNSSYQNFQNNVAQNYNGDGRTLADSNLILINKNFAANGINNDYKQIVENIYKSTIREADFTGNIEAEKKNISKWVANKTNNFIPNYNSIVSEETIMDILNVVYFKGDWYSPFEGNYTRSEEFTNKDDSKVRTEMMNQMFRNRIKYYEDAKFKAIEMPYKKLNGQNIVSMYIVLPFKSNDLNVADKWNRESLKYKQSFLDNIVNAPTFYGKVYVKLPKFELDIENRVKNNLQTMGIQRAFTNEAEFYKMINNASLKISNVNHRAKIKVDETGTEAAAITEIDMVETSAIPEPEPEVIKNFYADRPFLFVIKDVKYNVDLFVGVVNKL